MKKGLKWLSCFFVFIFVFQFVACTNKNTNMEDTENIQTTPICQHNYELTQLSIASQSEQFKTGIYTCSKCNQTKENEIGYEDIGLPVIDFTGSLDGISKENELKISVKYSSEEKSFECDAKIKVQGATSASYPKKNYTIKLYEKDTDFDKKYKVELVDGWGKENKYCLKANWIDYSQARNVVSAKLYGQIVHSKSSEDKLNTLYNGGAIDGYPVVIYLNGSFLGLYTMNIPKDKWLFNMDDYDPDKDEDVRKEAILMADAWTNSTWLTETINSDFSSSGWELEFCSTEETDIGTSWVLESFNNFITFLNNNDGESLKNGLGQFVDIDRAIDCLIYTNLLYACDNTSKNVLWVTYDGIKWIPSMYDMDGTWGLVWDGSMYNEINYFQYLSGHLLNTKLMNNYKNEIKNRYFELRAEILSLLNIKNIFNAFFESIPEIVRDAEKTKWNTVPSQNTNNLDQILKFTAIRLSFLDEYFVFKNA